MKKRIKSIIAASLSLVLVFSMTGCGSKERMEAEINPDTPVEDVEFPLKIWHWHSLEICRMGSLMRE